MRKFAVGKVELAEVHAETEITSETFRCSYLYQIVHLGEDDDEVTFSSATPIEEGDTFLFAPRALKNLAMVDEMDSLSPILTTQVKGSPEPESVSHTDGPSGFFVDWLYARWFWPLMLCTWSEQNVSGGLSFVEMMFSVFHLSECD